MVCKRARELGAMKDAQKGKGVYGKGEQSQLMRAEGLSWRCAYERLRLGIALQDGAAVDGHDLAIGGARPGGGLAVQRHLGGAVLGGDLRTHRGRARGRCGASVLSAGLLPKAALGLRCVGSAQRAAAPGHIYAYALTPHTHTHLHQLLGGAGRGLGQLGLGDGGLEGIQLRGGRERAMFSKASNQVEGRGGGGRAVSTQQEAVRHGPAPRLVLPSRSPHLGGGQRLDRVDENVPLDALGAGGRGQGAAVCMGGEHGRGGTRRRSACMVA